MKALVLTQYNRFEVQDWPEPVPGPREALVRVRACGICGSDVHGMDGSTGRRVPPIIMGHEAAGEIVGVGAEVEGWRAGERVTFDSTVYCGRCAFCRSGRVNLCDQRTVLGVSCGAYRRHGAMAEFVAVPEHILYRLPAGLSFEQAALVEALAIAVHAVDRTPLRLRDRVAVVGTGMIGLLVVQALRVAGAGPIVAVDVAPERLALARQFGATDAVRADQVDAVAAVQALTDGRGVDAAFEVVGLSATLTQAIQAVRKGGSVTLVGNVSATAQMPLQSVVTREVNLIGSCASCGEYPAALELMAGGGVDVRPLISAVAPLTEGGEWFRRLQAREAGLLKVVLTP